MMRREYDPKIAELRERVAQRFRSVMQERTDIKISPFANEYYQEMGCSSRGIAQTLLSSVINGHRYGYSTDYGKGLEYGSKELERLSRLLSFFEIEDNDQIIQDIRSQYPSFKYSKTQDIGPNPFPQMSMDSASL